MKTLVVEDDFTCRLLMQELLKQYGPVHIAVNGREAVEAATTALEAREPYDLVCLDIMMPEMDGQHALIAIRAAEEKNGIRPGLGSKIIMTTALSDGKNVMTAFREQCDGYLVKPISRTKLVEILNQQQLI